MKPGGHPKSHIIISPGQLTINYGTTFLVSDRTMQVREETDQGLYFSDTRFLSHYRYRFNRQLPLLLAAGISDYSTSFAHFTNNAIPLTMGETIAQNKIFLKVVRKIAEGELHEELRLTNFASNPIILGFIIEIKSDFADIFEVRGLHFPYRGSIETVWEGENRILRTSYHQGAFEATTSYRIAVSDSKPDYANGEIVFAISLEPRESWRALVEIGLAAGPESIAESRKSTFAPGFGIFNMERQHRKWHESVAHVSTGVSDIQHIIDGAGEDLAAIRMTLPGLPKDVWMPSAGIPWFATIFGRDSEIVSLQTLMIAPVFARATLQTLADLQGKTIDDRRQEEPGKIPHEIRKGHLAQLGRIPHTPYYGTVDATPLYIILLSETWRWTADEELVRRFMPNARAALQWIDNFGDHDGDGYLDYWRMVNQGLKNQGWKDSANGIVYEDGSNVPNPIAMIEFQGYVFDAKLRMAELEEKFGDPEKAEALRMQAHDLRRRFHDTFWMEKENFFAMGLGPAQRVIRSISSNPGHCLWSGIVNPSLAGKLVERLMADDLFSGWGIRTISRDNPAYNPLDYQLGAIWPHDNAIIALGCKRYGFHEATNRIARAIFDAASHFEGGRLPELFAGFGRDDFEAPVIYQYANIPQAWAAGSIFLLIRAILGLEADAPAGRLKLTPVLPDWLPDLTIRSMPIGRSIIDLSVVRRTDGTALVKVIRQKGVIEVMLENAEGSTISYEDSPGSPAV